ncbi:MAG TPA: polymer-forming cytoskeletal protein [Clostridiales bacterium]|nr:polymer-forming cytoskeletal protein [Clostridiales bacterium]
MFKKKNTGTSSAGSFNSLIGDNTIFEGNINCQGAIRIDGKVTGDIKSDDDIFIGETAIVKGNLYGNAIYVSGMVKGNIYSKSNIRFFSSGSIHGDIEAFSIITDEGAIFNGKCNTLVSEDSREAVPQEKGN